MSDERRSKYPSHRISSHSGYSHGHHHHPPPPHSSSSNRPPSGGSSSSRWERPRSRERDTWDWRESRVGGSRSSEWDHWDSRRDREQQRPSHYSRDDYRERDRERERDRASRVRRRSHSGDRYQRHSQRQSSTDPSGKRSASNESQPPIQDNGHNRDRSIPPHDSTKSRTTRTTDEDLFPHRIRQTSDSSARSRSPASSGDIRSKSPPSHSYKRDEHTYISDSHRQYSREERHRYEEEAAKDHGTNKSKEEYIQNEERDNNNKELRSPKQEDSSLEESLLSKSKKGEDEEKKAAINSNEENVSVETQNEDKVTGDENKFTKVTEVHSVVTENTEQDIEPDSKVDSTKAATIEEKTTDLKTVDAKDMKPQVAAISTEETSTKKISFETPMDLDEPEAESGQEDKVEQKQETILEEKGADENTNNLSNTVGGNETDPGQPSTDNNDNIQDESPEHAKDEETLHNEAINNSEAKEIVEKDNAEPEEDLDTDTFEPANKRDGEGDEDENMEERAGNGEDTRPPVTSDRPVAVAKDVLSSSDDSVESIKNDLKEGIIRFPLNRMEQALYELSIIPTPELRHNMNYLRPSPSKPATFRNLVKKNKLWFEGIKKDISSLVEIHDHEVDEKTAQLSAEYYEIRKSWLRFCAETDKEVSERSLESRGGESRGTNPVTPHTTSNNNNISTNEKTLEANNSSSTTTNNNNSNTNSSNERSSRRSRAAAGDTVRSEAEFLEILANLERESARDPSMRANLTSATVPGMIIDSVEREKFRFEDTNNYVIDKSVPYQRLISDAMDPFSPEEHEAFCEAYALYPKQFGKIARVMGTGRSYNDCVLHYYQTKKSVDYKSSVVTRGKRSSRKGNKRKQAPKEKIVTTPGGGKTIMSTEQGDAEGGDESGTSAPATSIPQNEENPFETLAAAAVATANAGRSARRTAAPVFGDDSTGTAGIENRKRSQEEVISTTTTEGKKKTKTTTTTTTTATTSAATGAKGKGTGVTSKRGKGKKDEEVEPDLDGSGESQPQQQSSTNNNIPPVPAREKVSSYWSLGEVATFEKLLPEYGTHWEEYAKHMKYKSMIMLKNFYVKHATDRGYESIAAKADATYDKRKEEERLQQEQQQGLHPQSSVSYGPPPSAQQQQPTPQVISTKQVSETSPAPPPPTSGPQPGYFPPRVSTASGNFTSNNAQVSNSSANPPSMQPVNMFPQPRHPQTIQSSASASPPQPQHMSGPKLPPISNLDIVSDGGHHHRQNSGTPPPPLSAPRPVIKPPRKSSISSILNSTSPSGEVKAESSGNNSDKHVLPPLGLESGHQLPPLPMRSYNNSPVQQQHTPPNHQQFQTKPQGPSPPIGTNPPQPQQQYRNEHQPSPQQPQYQPQPPSRQPPPQPHQYTHPLSQSSDTPAYHLYGYGDFTSRESNERGSVRGYGVPPTSNVRK